MSSPPLIATTIPDVVDSLLAHFTNVQASSGLTNFQVTDGDPIAYVANYYLSVTGWSNHHRVWASASGDFSAIEGYDLDCMIHCWQGDSGGTAPAARRREALTILDLVIAELLNDKQAGGALTMSGEWQVITSDPLQGPGEGAGGWGVDLAFTVHCENIYLTVT